MDVRADGQRLAGDHDSLAFGVRDPAPGAIYALALGGGFAVGAREGRTVVFGRNRPAVHVCVGEDDRKVSRLHGRLVCQDGRWWVSNTGRLPIRLPGSQWLFTNEASLPLASGYTPVFVPGTRGREHLLELYVAGDDPLRSNGVTVAPRTWLLSPAERLVLVALGQRYLQHESDPRPLGCQQVAVELGELEPDAGWTAGEVEHTVTAVRARLAKAGVANLTRDEDLLREMLLSTTLVPPDLRLLDIEEGGR